MSETWAWLQQYAIVAAFGAAVLALIAVPVWWFRVRPWQRELVEAERRLAELKRQASSSAPRPSAAQKLAK